MAKPDIKAKAAAPNDGADAGGTPPAPAAVYTRCWQLVHPGYGHLQVKCDTAEEATQIFLARKCQGIPPEKVRADLRVIELPFRKADTEEGKPGGWRKDKPKRKGGR